MALYHGGRARLRPGALITPGRLPNPWGDTFDDRGRSVYVYASPALATARSYADAIRATGRRAWVYEVTPTGPVFRDGAGDIRTRHPLRVVKLIEEND